MAKTAFLTISIDTGKAVQDFNSLKKTLKELEQQLKSLKPDDEGFEELKQKVILAKTEIFKFNEQLRVTPSFTEKLSNSIKIGMADVAIKAGKAEQAIHSLKDEQQNLAREINLTTDAAKKNNLVEEFKKLENQIKKNQTELHNFNQELNKGFAENRKQVGDFSIQVDKNFQETNNIISGSVKKIGNAFSEIGLAIGGAFAVEKILEFGVECVKAFSEAEKTAKLLQTAVGVNGGLQEDFERLIEQSEELQSKTIFSDDAIQKAQTAALQFGLTADEVQKLIPIITDFASATGQDLDSALNAVLQGAEGSAKALKQYGISIDANQSGSAKLADITQQLSKKFEGQAEIVAGTTSGSYELLKNKVDDVQESIGSFISDLAGGAVDIAAFALNGFKPLNDELSETSDKLFKTREQLVKFNVASTANEITILKSRIEELNKQDAGVAVTELSKQLKIAETRLQSFQKEELSFASDTQLKTKFTELSEQVKHSNSLFGDTTGIKQQFEAVKEELEKRKVAIISDEKTITTATSAELNNRLVELKNVYKETNSFDTKSTIDAIEIELKARKDGSAKIQSELKKQYDSGLKLIQQSNETEILSTKEGTLRRIEVTQQADEKEKQYKLNHLSELIQSEGVYQKDSESFSKEFSTRKENIIAVSNDKEIKLEQQKQTLLKQLLTQKQQQRLDLFPEGTIEKIEEQIRQAQERLSASFASTQSAISIIPKFDPAALVKYSSEIKKLYQDLANYNASIKKTELLTEQANIQAKLAAVKKGSQEEVDLKKQLIANKASLDKVEIDSKIAAYDAMRAAGIKFNESELAAYALLEAEKKRISAESNQAQTEVRKEHSQQQLEGWQQDLGEANNYVNGFATAFSTAYDSINNLERQRTDVKIQNIESELNNTIKSLDKQEQSELKTTTNKEATEAKFRRKKEQAEQAAHKQESALKKKQFEADKRANIVKAVINLAQGILTSLSSSPPPLNFILAALTAAAGAIQINAISSAPTPEFKQGGILNIPKYKQGGQLNVFETNNQVSSSSSKKYKEGGMMKIIHSMYEVARFADGGSFQGIVKGASHTEGGIKLVDSKTASVVGEVEGNETILTGAVSKNPTLLKQASEINVKAGGKPFLQYGGLLNFKSFTPPVLESGGVLGSTSVNVNNTVDFELMKDFFKTELDKPRRSYVVSTDITQSQNIDALIERRSRLVA